MPGSATAALCDGGFLERTWREAKARLASGGRLSEGRVQEGADGWAVQLPNW